MSSIMPSSFRLFPSSAATASPSTVLLATATVTVTAASLLYVKNSSKTSLEQETLQQQFQMDVDLMDRIAAKPYLPVTKHRCVPRRLRLLAIDVPEMRSQGIDGECRVNMNKIFSDGIAPPKTIAGTNVEVVQKSLAHALVKCRHKESLRIGVEMTEASVADLNPKNMRRTHQFGNYKYDPGKWTKTTKASSSSDGEEESNVALVEDVTVDDNDSTVTVTEEATVQQPKPASTNIKKDAPEGGTILATEEDEYDAPWNQYAWIQELQLRIGGKVAFGEPMQPSSRIQRLLFGSVYKTTIPSSRAPWEYLLLPIFHRNPAGTDSPDKKNWASNKPHAVIADGAAMQRVPGSLRFLQNVCQDNNVPLYIIHDPRVWGGNTHQALPEALQDMRKTIKQNIVLQAMQGGSSFSRGRMLGQAETEARWQAKDIGRRTRQAVRDANDKLKRERENDWSTFGSQELQDKLVERKVIVLHDGKDHKKGKSELTLPEYTSGMVDLSRQCNTNEEERQRQAGQQTEEVGSKSNATGQAMAS